MALHALRKLPLNSCFGFGGERRSFNAADYQSVPGALQYQIGLKHSSLVDREGWLTPGRKTRRLPPPGCGRARAAVYSEGEALPSFSGSVRHASDSPDGRNCWSVPDPGTFSVRSKSYLSNNRLEPAKEPLFTLVAVDWFRSDARMDCLAGRPGNLLNRTLKGGPPFVFVVNMQIPAGAVHYSMVIYFASQQPIAAHSLFHRFVNGDDAFRDARLTLLPNIAKGSWLIRQAVGSRSWPLAQTLKCRYDRGEHYFEVDVDMGTSPLVSYILSLVLPAVTSLVVDMAFLIRGESDDELPERLLGAVRLQTFELLSAIPPPTEDRLNSLYEFL